MNNTEKSIVLSVNLSSERGKKKPVSSITLKPGGAESDIHFISGNREVSILDERHILDFLRISESSGNPSYGAYAENITTRNLPGDIRIFDVLKTGEAKILVSQIGKPFHEKIEFPGHYVSPQKAIFGKVIGSGSVKAGDEIIHSPKTFKTLVLTISDRASQGLYKDKSGTEAQNIISDFFEQYNYRYQIDKKIIPDEKTALDGILREHGKYDLIISTGGTGISRADITIETIRPHLDKEIPGITEFIRWKYGIEKPQALLSRSLAGVKDQTLIFAIPGSPKAVKEYLNEFTKVADHSFSMIYGLSH